MACDAPLAVISGMAFEAHIAQGNGICALYGLNPQKLVQDIEDAIEKGVTGLLSFGTAAGLQPGLAAGTVVIARNVLSQGEVFKANEKWVTELAQQLPEALVANLAGVDLPLATSPEKKSLYTESTAVVADMESHHVARLAKLHNLPFAVVRVVLDNAECTLPPAALAATRPDGSVSYATLLGSLLLHPGQLPRLIRLAGDHAKAKQALLRYSDRLKGKLFGFMNLG